MYPHERSLVKRLKDKPFALIGVNSDPDKDKLKQIGAEISWWMKQYRSGTKDGDDGRRRRGRGSGADAHFDRAPGR